MFQSIALRRFITAVLVAAILVLLILVGVIVALDAGAPFLPGDALFPNQRWAENIHSARITEATAFASRWLDLLERRIHNLTARTGTIHEEVAVAYVDEALNAALRAIAFAPLEAQPALYQRLYALMDEWWTDLANLTVLPAHNAAAYLNVLAKINAVRVASRGVPDATTAATLSDLAGLPLGLTASAAAGGPAATPIPYITPQGIPFPPNATPGDHSRFVLTGRHAITACAKCHPANTYRGTPNTCTACHASIKPEPHFAGDCLACHSTIAWTPASFDHVNATDCQSCHLAQRPIPHYEGQCSACHNTSAWTPATFNHSTIGSTDCSACHTPPQNHYAGACTLCHTDTGNWRNATFNHSTIGSTDCSACHTPPQNHYAGACTLCHTDTGDWRNATFNHSTIGSTDCSACHTPPQNHFAGACTSCHSDTGNWRNATFNHTFPLNHGEANGQCATCHAASPPAWSCTACHDTARMDDKHRDVGGYSTNCIACHLDGREP